MAVSEMIDVMKNMNKGYLVIGVAVVVLGMLVLANLLDVVRGNDIYELLWPIMIFATGLGLVSSPGAKGLGYIILWIGFLLLLRQMHIFDSDAGKTILVLILALTGLGILTQAGDRIAPKDS